MPYSVFLTAKLHLVFLLDYSGLCESVTAKVLEIFFIVASNTIINLRVKLCENNTNIAWLVKANPKWIMFLKSSLHMQICFMLFTYFALVR